LILPHALQNWLSRIWRPWSSRVVISRLAPASFFEVTLQEVVRMPRRMILTHSGRRLGLVLQMMMSRTAIEATLMLVPGYSVIVVALDLQLFFLPSVEPFSDVPEFAAWMMRDALDLGLSPFTPSSRHPFHQFRNLLRGLWTAVHAHLASEDASPLSLYAPPSKPQVAHWKEELAQVINTAYAGSEM
jgi:hypothetical protein